MKILIIEDNDLKFELLMGYLQELNLESNTTRASSYKSGIIALAKNIYDRVILDMTLPVFDVEQSVIESETLTFGGKLILRETKRKKWPAQFIVFSQYDTFLRDGHEVAFEQLKAEIKNEYTGLVMDCIRLDRSTSNWKNELGLLLK